MYLKWLNFINTKKVILGSNSIQRKELFNEAGIKYDVIVSNFPENLPKSDPKKYVEDTSLGKLHSIINDNPSTDIDILITSDVVKVLDDIIIEKAENEEMAYKWLISFSEKTLKSVNSVCIALVEKDNNNVNKIKDLDLFTTETFLKMNKIDDEIAKAYIKTGEWYNRSGAIAISRIGKSLVKEINGDFYTIVGFPFSEFSIRLSHLLEKHYGNK